MDVARIKIIWSRPIKTTGTLVVILKCTYIQKEKARVLCLNVYECEVGRMQVRTRKRGLFEVSLSLLAASRMRGWGAVKQSLLAASFPIGFSCRIYTLFN